MINFLRRLGTPDDEVPGFRPPGLNIVPGFQVTSDDLRDSPPELAPATDLSATRVEWPNAELDAAVQTAPFWLAALRSSLGFQVSRDDLRDGSPELGLPRALSSVPVERPNVGPNALDQSVPWAPPAWLRSLWAARIARADPPGLQTIEPAAPAPRFVAPRVAGWAARPVPAETLGQLMLGSGRSASDRADLIPISGPGRLPLATSPSYGAGRASQARLREAPSTAGEEVSRASGMDGEPLEAASGNTPYAPLAGSSWFAKEEEAAAPLPGAAKDRDEAGSIEPAVYRPERDGTLAELLELIQHLVQQNKMKSDVAERLEAEAIARMDPGAKVVTQIALYAKGLPHMFCDILFSSNGTSKIFITEIKTGDAILSKGQVATLAEAVRTAEIYIVNEEAAEKLRIKPRVTFAAQRIIPYVTITGGNAAAIARQLRAEGLEVVPEKPGRRGGPARLRVIRPI
ncbi:MAG: hypothetical protein U1E23_07605 [Reyranellaceae bacterium]